MTVNSIKNKEKSAFGSKVDMPDVEIEDVIANKTFENSSS